MSEPYRKPGERTPIAPELRRWFTKSGDVEKGPFERTAILRSLKEGYIKRTTLVRAEDQSEWLPLSQVKELTGPAPRPNAPRPAPTHVAALEPGNYWLGFVVSICAGLIGLIVIYATSREIETRRGALNGFFVRIGLTVALVVVMFVAISVMSPGAR